MFRNYALCFLIILFTLNIFTFSKASSLAVNKFALSAQNTLSIPIDGYFTENKGQWNKNLLFVAKTGFGHIALSRNCIYYNIIYVDSLDKKRTNALDRKILNYYSEAKENHSIEYNLVGYVIKVEFKEVRNISSIGMYPCKFKSNFFYGNNSKKWVTDVSSYREVIYPNIYEGIDLICYFESGEFFFEFVSYNNINFDSILSLISIEGIENTNFKLIKEHDKTRTSSKFYLTSIKLKHFDYALSIDVDSFSNAYACGWTFSPDFPTTPGTYDRNINGYTDSFILKLDSSGSELIYSTFVGVENTYTLTSIDIDSSGNVYACGWTRSKNFPTTFDSVNRNYKGGNTEAVILKFNKDGSNLIFSTYIGGEGKD